MSNWSWPAARTAAQFGAVRRDEARLRPGVLALCNHLGLSGARLARFAGGSLLAYALLHRHSNLPKYLQYLPVPPAQTLGALARRWWRLD